MVPLIPTLFQNHPPQHHHYFWHCYPVLCTDNSLLIHISTSDLFFTQWEAIDLHCFSMWSRDNSHFRIESAIERKGIMSSLYYFSKTSAWEKEQMLLFPLKIPYKPFPIIYTHNMHWFYIESGKIDYSYRDQTLSIWEKLEIQVRTCVQWGSEENGHGPSITQQHCSSQHASLSQLYQ